MKLACTSEEQLVYSQPVGSPGCPKYLRSQQCTQERPPENSEGPACEVCVFYQGNILCSTESNANIITESLQSLQAN